MTKRQRKNRKRINRLVELWPELFNREKPQPLKVEIPDDLIQDIAIRELAFGAGALRAAVASYVRSPRYYRALMAGGARYDLKGQPCGEVTPQEQKEAETRLMMLNDRRKARKYRRLHNCADSLSCNQCTALYRTIDNGGHNR